MSHPRLTISGLAGGTGKTVVSLGIARALSRRGLAVRGYKKGPDYIDTAWLAHAARGPASNLDPFLLSRNALLTLFDAGTRDADISIIEGSRGFFDGLDLSGSAATSELARFLDSPVVLVVDCTKVTRTVAALVAGCRHFPGGERIVGVILNRTGRSRHADLTRRAVEELAGVPVFGVLPRLATTPILERREGLVTVQASQDTETALNALAAIVEEQVDLTALLAVARSAPPLPEHETVTLFPSRQADAGRTDRPVRIGVVNDAVLWQYYEENLEALRRAGATLIPLSLLRRCPLRDIPTATPGAWPELDGLYLGGGDLAPYAATLAADTERRAEVAALVASGLPVYAEQAGFFYLLDQYQENSPAAPLPMAGVFPFRAVRKNTPQGLGYVQTVPAPECPYLPPVSLRGHEFRFESLEDIQDNPGLLARDPNFGISQIQDGFLRNNCFGTLMQLYAPAAPTWSERFVALAKDASGGQGKEGSALLPLDPSLPAGG